jgi:Flp pilus assembly protein TadG
VELAWFLHHAGPAVGEKDKVIWSEKTARIVDAHEMGSALLEFVWAVAVFLALIFGIIQLGFAIYGYHWIAAAARMGSRYAMLHGSSCVANGSSCTATAAQIQSYVLSQDYPGVSTSQMSVSTSYAAYPAGATCSPNPNCSNPGNLVTVKVSYTFLLSIPFVPSSNLSMSSSSAVVISQ